MLLRADRANQQIFLKPSLGTKLSVPLRLAHLALIADLGTTHMPPVRANPTLSAARQSSRERALSF